MTLRPPSLRPVALALAVAAPALAAPALAQAQAQPVVVKLGHVAPLTGPQAHLGKDNELAARMAVEELNAKKLVIGGKPVQFQLLSEDDAADPRQGTAAAQKLVDAKVAGVIGHLNSGTTIPASRLYSEAGIPQVSPSSTNPKYTQQGFKTAFRVVANDAQLGGTLGRYAVGTLKAKTIAVIDDRTAYGQGVADEFAKAAKAAGATVAGREYTTDKATDFTAILTKIKAMKPDVVFYGGMDAQAGPLVRQMKQLGIDAKVMGGDGACTTEMPRLAGEALGNERVYCAEAGGVTPDRKAKWDEFRARFKQKHGVEVKLYAPYVYDATMVVANAMQKANATDPKTYLPVLAKTDYDGVTGRIVFDDKGDIRDGALTIYTYRNGQREQVVVTK